MIGVTIGAGPWKEVAEASARRMQQMTGLKCVLLPDEFAGEPALSSWSKCKVFDAFPDETFIMVFDADIWCMKEWDPREFAGAAAFVPEQPNTATDAECSMYGLYRERYVNGGLWIVGNLDTPLLDATYARFPSYGRWMEQTALNKAIVELEYPVRYLPRAYNDICRPTGNTDPEYLRQRHSINLHFAGPKTPEWCLGKFEELGDQIR